MGNPRKPRTLKLLEGTSRPDRDKPEPEFPKVEGVPTPPDWLLDTEAVAEWNRLGRLLTEAGVLTEPSLHVLANLCNIHAALVKIWRAGGAPPDAATLTQYRLMAVEFGLTPKSQANAGGAGQKEKKNAFLDLDKKPPKKAKA